MAQESLQLTPYRPEFGLDVVRLWRQSFQRAMGLPEQNRFDEVLDQLRFLRTIDPARITAAIRPDSSSIIGFLAASGSELDHLYVHVDWQGQGIGSRLLEHAKAQSPGCLELFTFAQNSKAQRFYLAHGFHEVRRGMAAPEDNPWASSPDQLADILYRWER